jgi:hypothetical protein
VIRAFGPGNRVPFLEPAPAVHVPFAACFIAAVTTVAALSAASYRLDAR